LRHYFSKEFVWALFNLKTRENIDIEGKTNDPSLLHSKLLGDLPPGFSHDNNNNFLKNYLLLST
jgi:hypothetical protein